MNFSTNTIHIILLILYIYEVLYEYVHNIKKEMKNGIYNI